MPVERTVCFLDKEIKQTKNINIQSGHNFLHYKQAYHNFSHDYFYYEQACHNFYRANG